MTASKEISPMAQQLLGKMFLNPLVDYLLIGGALSLVFVPIAAHLGESYPLFPALALPVVMLLSNSSHFAASTVRLYTRENCYNDFPFLTMLFPAITIFILTLAILFPEHLGANIQALYLTWSPYHYARQAYGLSVMYCYRSGCTLTTSQKRILLISCLLPFLLVIITKENSGLLWVIPMDQLAAFPPAYVLVWILAKTLPILSFLLPSLLFLSLLKSSANGARSGAMPIISVLLILTNAIWWISFDYQSAFIWATVFHGIQYLVIMLIFHVRDKLKSTNGKNLSAFQHGLRFYAACLILGYLLFQCWPYFYVWAGFGLAESMLLVIAVINLHHFIVDGYIWRLRKDPNYNIVVSERIQPSAATF